MSSRCEQSRGREARPSEAWTGHPTANRSSQRSCLTPHCQNVSREAAECESPARQCRVGKADDVSPVRDATQSRRIARQAEKASRLRTFRESTIGRARIHSCRKSLPLARASAPEGIFPRRAFTFRHPAKTVTDSETAPAPVRSHGIPSQAFWAGAPSRLLGAGILIHRVLHFSCSLRAAGPCRWDRATSDSRSSFGRKARRMGGIFSTTAIYSRTANFPCCTVT
jgi:hypothetical protein